MISTLRIALRQSSAQRRQLCAVPQKFLSSTSLSSCSSIRYFSEAAAAPDDAESSDSASDQQQQNPIVWTTHRLNAEQIEKVDQIFRKLLWLDMFEVDMVNTEVNRRLGVVLTPKQRNAISRQLQLRQARLRGDVSVNDNGESGDAAEAEAVGPKLVDLKLAGFEAKSKIKVIKEVRSIAGLGLKEAKELVESSPATIQKGLKEEEAEELKTKLEAIGAQIELV